MLTPVVGLISNLYRPDPGQVSGRTHFTLAGINQMIFLKQWGEPETRFGLNPLGRFNKLGSMFLITEPKEDTHHSVWIYQKRKEILFFTKKKLVYHYKWKEFT
jgi:hypothetical protein